MADRSELLYDIWVDRIRGMSAQDKGRLARYFGGSKGLCQAGAAEICFALTGKSLRGHPREGLWKSLFRPDLGPAEEQLEIMEKKKIGALPLLTREYPESLRVTEGPPWMLYYRGWASCIQNPGFAVVGARSSTDYGRWAAFELARRLAGAGVTVVSGMARGIDSAAHRGALKGAGPGGKCTVAVFGCGVDVCYPKTNAGLMEEIIENGAVVSELPPGTGPRPYFFPRRNRIISGLSRGVAVMEAGLQSGSLITAELAAEQGRDVYALPGNINRAASIGANQLIRDGAAPIVVLDDVLREMGYVLEKVTEFQQNQLGTDERKVYNELLHSGELSADQLARKLEMPAGKVNALVTILEMKGILQTALGKIFIAKT